MVSFKVKEVWESIARQCNVSRLCCQFVNYVYEARNYSRNNIIDFFCRGSCSKNSQNVPASVATVAGIWSVVNDSGFAGISLNNHAVDYTGQIGDHFDFRADGNIYVKEGPVSDTLQYTITSGNTMQISFLAGKSYNKSYQP